MPPPPPRHFQLSCSFFWKLLELCQGGGEGGKGKGGAGEGGGGEIWWERLLAILKVLCR